MIHLNHMLVLSERGFAARELHNLFCAGAQPPERQVPRGWGLGRRR